MQQPQNRNKAFAFLGALLTWTAVLLQFYLIIENRVAPVPETIIRFFSFFTVLSNIIVAICFTMLVFRADLFFTKPNNLTAVTLYILIVGIIYNLILRNIWAPTGLQKLADELLHVVVPILFFLYWLLVVSKDTLQWKNISKWLLFPLVYVILVLIRGAASGFYPYPFLNVGELGTQRVLINAVFIFLAFGLVAALLIGIGKFIQRKKRISNPVL